MEKERDSSCSSKVWTSAVNTTDSQETMGEKGTLKKYHEVYDYTMIIF